MAAHECDDPSCDKCFEPCVLCPQRVRRDDNTHLLSHLAAQRRTSQMQRRVCSCCLDAACTCIAAGASPSDLNGPHFEGVPSKVTVVTGFLGSGKSTLVSKLCEEAEQKGERLAVLVNEYADTTGLERAAGAGGSKVLHRDEWVELGGGCICCRRKGETMRALQGLLRSRGWFDHIVVETSGIADPAVLAREIEQAGREGKALRFGGVICVVDAARARRHFVLPAGEGGMVGGDGERLDEAAEQLAQADVVVLSKTDRVPPEEVESLGRALHCLNPTAPVVPASRGVRDDREPVLSLLEPRRSHQWSPLPPVDMHRHAHAHTSDLGWVEFGVDGSFKDLDTARGFCDALHAEKSGVTLLRAKGLLLFHDGAAALQSVGNTWELTPAESDSKRTRVVVIGRSVKGFDWDTLLRSHLQA
eukprot:Hpha_TRINITY_DN15915_c5_g3::TRINITY_DN15915_c5_g3_i1::g.73253::m.73253